MISVDASWNIYFHILLLQRVFQVVLFECASILWREENQRCKDAWVGVNMMTDEFVIDKCFGLGR